LTGSQNQKEISKKYAVSLIYLRTIVVIKAGALTKLPYDLIGNEKFLCSKCDDAIRARKQK
jgi:hypothetical protein